MVVPKVLCRCPRFHCGSFETITYPLSGVSSREPQPPPKPVLGKGVLVDELTSGKSLPHLWG